MPSILSTTKQEIFTKMKTLSSDRLIIKVDKTYLKETILLRALYVAIALVGLVATSLIWTPNNNIHLLTEIGFSFLGVVALYGLFHALVILPFRYLFVDEQNIGEIRFRHGLMKEVSIPKNEVAKVVNNKYTTRLLNKDGKVLHSTNTYYWDINELKILTAALVGNKASSKGIWI